MAPLVHTPVEGFTGTVAGVNFSDGVGETDNLAALAYFESAGYEVEHDDTEESESEQRAESDEESEGSESEDDESEGDESEGGESEEDESESIAVAAPHPVKGNKAVWFEHLTTLNPDHGFDLEKVTRAELIAAVEELTAK